MHVFGVKEQQEALINKLSNEPSLILYPGKTASSIADYKDLYAAQDGNLNICVIDSTWTQSHTMEKSLPAHIPRVKVDDFVLKASEFLNRKQSQADRVSTIEAVTIALQALGESPERLLPMQRALHLSVDAVNRLRGKTESFGTNFVSQITAHTDQLNCPYTPSTVVRPESCPLCHASHTSTIFKNLGVRKGHYQENFNATALLDVSSEASTSACSGKFHRAWKCQSCKQSFYVNGNE